MTGPGIWVLNPGSSSIKCAWFASLQAPAAQCRSEHGAVRADELVAWLASQRSAETAVVRVVHGGVAQCRPLEVNEAELRRLEECSGLAPLHNRLSLELMRALLAAGVVTRVIAVFDTEFFHDLPVRAVRYGLPRTLADKHGVRRLGFDGFAHDAMRKTWENQIGHEGRNYRLVTIQLGSGCSMAAIRDGHPLDTTMGFTPNEGLLMSTRCGDVDPGLITWLQRREGWTPDQTDEVLNRHSGWYGISGISGNLADLLDNPAPAAREAMAVFAHRIRKALGGFHAILGGLDGVVLSGGIAERSLPICLRLLWGLEHLGIRLDLDREPPSSGLLEAGDFYCFSATGSPVRCGIAGNGELEAMLDSLRGSCGK